VSGGNRRQNTGLTNRNHIGGGHAGIRGQLTLKSDTYTEGVDVYVAGISVKETVHYPGRPLNLLRAIVIER
jgi:hypothetical protein